MHPQGSFLQKLENVPSQGKEQPGAFEQSISPTRKRSVRAPLWQSECLMFVFHFITRILRNEENDGTTVFQTGDLPKQRAYAMSSEMIAFDFWSK
jgi:hypothetical protein